MNCCVWLVCTEALAGKTEMVVKTGGALVQDGNLKEAICVLQLKLPFAFRYSLV